MATLELRAGELVGGRYQLLQELARGGMGSVWSGRDTKLKRDVAVKLVAPDWGGAHDAQERFEREAMAVARMQSPHVVQIFDYGVERQCPFIVMELLDGEDLRSRLRKLKRVSLETAAHILVQTAKALSAAHAANIVHRDLKPGNIFLVRSGEEEIVKVLDFGVAVSVGDDAPEAGQEEGAILGTPQFMSPEQARGIADLDHRTDLWSLGVIIYRALSGRMPFKGGSPTDVVVAICTQPFAPVSKLAPDLPRELDAFFDRALARDRDHRFSSAREMALAFSRISPVTFTTLSMPDPSPAIDEAIRVARAAQKQIEDEELATVALGAGGPVDGAAIQLAVQRATAKAKRGEPLSDEDPATMAIERSLAIPLVPSPSPSSAALFGARKPLRQRVPPPPAATRRGLPAPPPRRAKVAAVPSAVARSSKPPPPPGSKPVRLPPPPPSRSSDSEPPITQASAAQSAQQDDDAATVAIDRESLNGLPLMMGALIEDDFDDEDEVTKVGPASLRNPDSLARGAQPVVEEEAPEPLAPCTTLDELASDNDDANSNPSTLDPAISPSVDEYELEPERSNFKSNALLVLAAILAGVLIAVIGSAVFKNDETLSDGSASEPPKAAAAGPRNAAEPAVSATPSSEPVASSSADALAATPSAKPSSAAAATIAISPPVARHPSPSPAPASAPPPPPSTAAVRPPPPSTGAVRPPPPPDPSDPFAERL